MYPMSEKQKMQKIIYLKAVEMTAFFMQKFRKIFAKTLDRSIK